MERLGGHRAGNGPTSSGPDAVVVEGVTVVRGHHRALADASVRVEPGTWCALIGPNGSGKSTLLHTIAGLLEPVEGQVTVLGDAPASRTSSIAYVLQSPPVAEQLPLTVRDSVAMGRFPTLGWFGRSRQADRDAVEEAMERLGVADLASRQLHELSGGQRQRVLVAQGLAQRAPLLLLDEPVTGLDMTSRQRILEVAADERDRGTTVVMSTHDLREAARTDHVVLLAGRVVADGPPAEVLVPDVLREGYGAQVLVLGDDHTVWLDDPHHHDDGSGHVHDHAAVYGSGVRSAGRDQDHTVCADDDEVVG